jgi:membrane protein implicated in regulation of membrane protease activity
MTTPADLFNFTLLATSGLYVSMLLYFNGFLGTKKINIPIQWNSEPILWFLTLMFMASLTFRFAGNDPSAEGPGVWYLTGTGPLLVIYICLILKVARHAVLQQIFWVMAALSTLAILYVLGNIFLAVFADASTPIRYPERIGNLLLWMTVLLCAVLLWCLLISLWTSFLRGRSMEPGSVERQTAEANVVQAAGAAEINLDPGADMVLDFGKRLIEDHGYKADLRVSRSNTDAPVTVEVSNDSSRWAPCEIDEHIPTDYDVPYIGSPWRYVRVCNSGNQPVSIGKVYDLD